MKKLIAALLVLTMVLALTGTVAMADCKFKVGAVVRFTKNAYAYDGHHDSDKLDTIVRKGSQAIITDTCGSKWVKLILHPDAVELPWGSSGQYISGWDLPEAWFKVDDLRVPANPKKHIVYYDGQPILEGYIHVVYSQGGKNMSLPFLTIAAPASQNKYCHVKATSKVWMHRVPALQKNYGRALHDGDKVKFRHKVGLDTRCIWFYGIRYDGKNLWVSSEYSKLVK